MSLRRAAPPPSGSQPAPPSCGTCRNPMWWDTTYPYPPCWYCSVCAYPENHVRGPGKREKRDQREEAR
ncbi:hypothetical protein LRS74_12545 [Streptomyces sp. LX-29]|uniref:hypothetical protein n=1 Tax=Streptomyces sp. LX-29 TaxID=2900152 RepID=UPI00240D5F08|nr:hypothetical protein [Streptomyces sp. LX-29]WFB07783.1 hypothetical protein LRS74_12545 [Streptomyces sp. LX-29]